MVELKFEAEGDELDRKWHLTGRSGRSPFWLPVFLKAYLVVKSTLFGDEHFRSPFTGSSAIRSCERVEHKFLTWHYHRLQSKNNKTAVEGNKDYAAVTVKMKEKRDEDALFNESCAFMDGQSFSCSKVRSLIILRPLQI